MRIIQHISHDSAEFFTYRNIDERTFYGSISSSDDMKKVRITKCDITYACADVTTLTCDCLVACDQPSIKFSSLSFWLHIVVSKAHHTTFYRETTFKFRGFHETRKRQGTTRVRVERKFSRLSAAENRTIFPSCHFYSSF